MSQTTFPVPSSGGSSKVQKTEIIKSTQSWTAPTGVTQVEVILCAGGQAGGNNPGTSSNQGGWGGYGSVDYSVLTVSPGTSYTITIGAGGSSNLAAGTASSFGALFTVSSQALGGTGGGYGKNATVGTGSGVAGATGGAGFQGFGGGGGGGGANSGGGAGSNGGGRGGEGGTGGSSGAANTGSGGGGAGSGAFSGDGQKFGGAGGSGICIIKYWA